MNYSLEVFDFFAKAAIAGFIPKPRVNCGAYEYLIRLSQKDEKGLAKALGQASKKDQFKEWMFECEKWVANGCPEIVVAPFEDEDDYEDYTHRGDEYKLGDLLRIKEIQPETHWFDVRLALLFTDLPSRSDFEEHSRQAAHLVEYDYLNFYYRYQDEWELISDKTVADLFPNGKVSPSGGSMLNAYYLMTIPVRGGRLLTEYWSFTPSWDGCLIDYTSPRLSKWDELEEVITPQVRGKRKSLENKINFNGATSMRMA